MAYHRIEKSILFLAILLPMLLAGFSIYFFITDFEHWYVYLIFFGLGVVFLILLNVHRIRKGHLPS